MPPEDNDNFPAEDRTNDPTASVEDFDWSSAFKEASDKVAEREGESPSDDSGSRATPPPTPVPGSPPPPPAAPGGDASKAAETPPAAASTGGPGEFPKSWSKDLEPIWGTIPEAARAQIHKREQDILRGISYYKPGHDFVETIKPALDLYKDYIADGSIEPRSLVTNLLQGHYLLANSDEPKRVEVFKTLMRQYQVSPEQLFAGMTGAGGGQQQNEDGEIPPAARRVIERLQAELNSVKSTTSALANTETQRQREQVAREEATARSQVAEFISKPDKPFARELLPDMHRLVASGAVATLEEAYDHAVWANPNTRTRLIQEQAKAAQTAAQRARDAASANIRTQGTSGTGEQEPEGSLDDTLRTRLKELNAQG